MTVTKINQQERSSADTVPSRPMVSRWIMAGLIFFILAVNLFFLYGFDHWTLDEHFKRCLLYWLHPKHLPVCVAEILWIATIGELIAFCLPNNIFLTLRLPQKWSKTDKPIPSRSFKLNFASIVRKTTWFLLAVYIVVHWSLVRLCAQLITHLLGTIFFYLYIFVYVFYYTPFCDYFITGKLTMKFVLFSLLSLIGLFFMVMYTRRLRRLSLRPTLSWELAVIFLIPILLFLLSPGLSKQISSYNVNMHYPMFSNTTTAFFSRYIPALIILLVGCYFESFFRLKWTNKCFRLFGNRLHWTQLSDRIQNNRRILSLKKQMEKSKIGRVAVATTKWLIFRLSLEKLPMTVRVLALIVFLWLLISRTDFAAFKDLFA